MIAPNGPSIATTLSETTGFVGDTVHDSATLTGATANAGGTVMYTVYSDSAYTGDANNLPAFSACTSEQLVINKLPSTISTAQVWTPQDTATIDHGGGTVAFTLYKNDSTCSIPGAAVYGPDTESVSTTSPFQASTNNKTFLVLAVTPGDTYYWGAADTPGDAAHKKVTSCTESTGFSSLANGGSVTSP